MKPYDLLTGILFLILAGIVFFDALRIGIFPIGAGTMPAIVAILLAACAVALIISSLKRTADADKPPAWPQKRGLINLLYVGVVIALYIFAMQNVGFLISTFLFTAVLLYQLSPLKWYKTIIVGLLVSIACFWVFEKLGLTLPRWFLERYLA